MATNPELLAKVAELQAAVDTEQQEVTDLIAQKDSAIEALNVIIADLQAQVAAGGTEAERQAILDSLNAVVADLQATV